MSKIFDAYRKRDGVVSDLSAELSPVDSYEVFPHPAPKQQDEFTRLAAQLQALGNRQRGTVLCFASSVHGEGSSFISYHTARFLAKSYQKKVAWIDCNYLRPQLELQGQGRLSFADLLQDPQRVHMLSSVDSITLIPGGAQLNSMRGKFSSDGYTDLLTELSQSFDFTIIDLPPVLTAHDAASMAAKTDGMLLVIEQKFLKREIIEHGLQGLRSKGVPVLGSVINRRSFELPKYIYDRL